MAKLIRFESKVNGSAPTPQQSADIRVAIMRNIFLGKTAIEDYTNDPVCGDFCKTQTFEITTSGSNVVASATPVTSGACTVDYGNFKVRICAAFLTSGSPAAVAVLPFVEDETYYVATATSSTLPETYSKTQGLPTSSVTGVEFPYNYKVMSTATSTAFRFSLLIDIERGTVAFWSSYVPASTIWKKSSANSFFSLSVGQQLTLATMFDTGLTKDEPLTLNTNIGPVFTVAGCPNTLSLYRYNKGSLVNSFYPDDPTVSPVVDFSSSYLQTSLGVPFKSSDVGLKLLSPVYYDTAVLNNGVTYLPFGSFILSGL